jgi:SAM-dependent methyltransferase
MEAPILETIACPYCASSRHHAWAQELGFTTVRCADCGLLYCNPRPAAAFIDAAVRTGAHGPEAQGLVVTARRIAGKVARYHRVFSEMFDDLWSAGRPISWLDVGAGYGEVLEAVNALAPAGSRICGLEPMHPKAVKARERGLTIVEDYLRPGQPKVQVISVVDVFSHIPDFGAFLGDVCAVLEPGGELYVETGNLADLATRDEFPGELGLPDHLVFAGEKHLLGYLDRAGFDIVRIRRWRIDGIANLAKNIAKKVLGRPAAFGVPYTSKYRQIQVRARLRPCIHSGDPDSSDGVCRA